MSIKFLLLNLHVTILAVLKAFQALVKFTNHIDIRERQDNAHVQRLSVRRVVVRFTQLAYFRLARALRARTPYG